MTYDGNKWNICDRNEVIHDMIEDNTNILEDKIEDWLEKGKQYPEIMRKFNRYIEKKENDINYPTVAFEDCYYEFVKNFQNIISSDTKIINMFF